MGVVVCGCCWLLVVIECLQVLRSVSLFYPPLGPGAFNAELEEFSTIDRALGTLLFAVLGESVDFREISGTNRFLAPMFHFLFTFVVSILFFSLFITMVDEAYNAVNHEKQND